MRPGAASPRFLLLINEPGLARYRPGKLYDYLAAGRSVLVFGEGGEVADLVRALDAGMRVPAGDESALAEAREALEAGTGYRTDDRGRREWLRAHTRQRLADEMFAILCRVAEGSRRPPPPDGAV